MQSTVEIQKQIEILQTSITSKFSDIYAFETVENKYGSFTSAICFHDENMPETFFGNGGCFVGIGNSEVESLQNLNTIITKSYNQMVSTQSHEAA